MKPEVRLALEKRWCLVSMNRSNVMRVFDVLGMAEAKGYNKLTRVLSHDYDIIGLYSHWSTHSDHILKY